MLTPTFLFDFFTYHRPTYLAPLSHNAQRGRRQKDSAVGISRLYSTPQLIGPPCCVESAHHRKHNIEIMYLVVFQVIGWKFDSLGMNPSAESYLLVHRFGAVSPNSCRVEDNEWGQFTENLPIDRILRLTRSTPIGEAGKALRHSVLNSLQIFCIIIIVSLRQTVVELFDTVRT